ncbi:MAG: hypothetical protein GXO89_12200 [Chlorobi bacterium]|nr:hypothetical protein [Chlorobiota bacterium]
MKKLNGFLVIVILVLGFSFQSCKKDNVEEPQQKTGILPSNFKVDIPSSLSGDDYLKSTNGDTLQGDDIYQHTRTFIWIGENAADIVNEIITVISVNELNEPMSFNFVSDDDGRVKHVVITEDPSFEGQVYEFQMTITDEGQASADIGSTALQIFWNRSPVKGTAIINPYNLDRTTEPMYEETMYRIDYSEAGELGYEHHMIVTLAGLPLADPLDDPYAMKTMRMFVGKNGDAISIYGNSDHPNAKFFNDDVGFDWAFTAAGKQSTDIGVAEVGLPSNVLNSSDRYELLVENSIKNVFTEQIYDVWPWIDSTTVQSYLYNTEAPGFFDHGGFVQGGTAPSPDYNSLLNIIAGLTPYNPATINNLEIEFKP